MSSESANNRETGVDAALQPISSRRLLLAMANSQGSFTVNTLPRYLIHGHQQSEYHNLHLLHCHYCSCLLPIDKPLEILSPRVQDHGGLE